MTYNPYNATAAANIASSTDTDRLEEIVRDCTRALRSTRRVMKYSTDAARTEAAAAEAAGYSAKMEAANARLIELEDIVRDCIG